MGGVSPGTATARPAWIEWDDAREGCLVTTIRRGTEEVLRSLLAAITHTDSPK